MLSSLVVASASADVGSDVCGVVVCFSLVVVVDYFIGIVEFGQHRHPRLLHGSTVVVVVVVVVVVFVVVVVVVAVSVLLLASVLLSLLYGWFVCCAWGFSAW